MTDQEIFGSIIVVAAIVSFFRGKKKPPQMMFIEVFEFVPVKRKRSSVLGNLLFVAGMALFIWIMNR